MVCGVGSTGRIVSDLIYSANNNGHSAKVACATLEPAKQVANKDIIYVGSKLDYYIHNILSRFTDHEGLFSKNATKRLIDQIKEYTPDIVHLHNIHGHWINFEILFKYLSETNVKVVWTLHDCWGFTGHCSYFSVLGCEQWKTLCRKCLGTKVYPMCYGKGDARHNFERKKNAFTSIDPHRLTIVSVSNWLDNFVGDSFLKNYPHIIIHNGIDLDNFKPLNNVDIVRNKLGIKDSEVMILGVACPWSKRKGLQDFIELNKILPPTKKIVLVGLNEKQIKLLPSSIIGIQRTNSVKELAEYYAAADIFLNLTYEDNYPTTNLESISCGTPCLTYRTGGSPESITENIGYVVRRGDISSVAAIINTIHARNIDKTRQCRDYAEHNFSSNKSYEQYFQLYESLISCS